ncbi:hypothetical protein [Nocardia arthritidis]|uniref:Uncharacterized protein n=1 Tax=Nocardia arthritidis TaxID=228602 RepID=A0A6G9YHB8_9NOCA|nr:hypothetical protein [Nocardia arthritidis]QIS12436.1 hypothetical protein F5544_22875 [Nocardia arthritidis]
MVLIFFTSIMLYSELVSTAPASVDTLRRCGRNPHRDVTRYPYYFT